MYFKKNLKENKIRRFDLCLLKQTKKKMKGEKGKKIEGDPMCNRLTLVLLFILQSLLQNFNVHV